MNFRFIPSILIWPAVAAGTVLLSGCAEPAPPPPTALRPVKTIIMESGSKSIRDRVFSGSARSAEEVALSFKVSGTVAQVPAAIGDVLTRKFHKVPPRSSRWRPWPIFCSTGWR